MVMQASRAVGRWAVGRWAGGFGFLVTWRLQPGGSHRPLPTSPWSQKSAHHHRESMHPIRTQGGSAKEFLDFSNSHNQISQKKNS